MNHGKEPTAPRRFINPDQYRGLDTIRTALTSKNLDDLSDDLFQRIPAKVLKASEAEDLSKRWREAVEEQKSLRRQEEAAIIVREPLSIVRRVDIKTGQVHEPDPYWYDDDDKDPEDEDQMEALAQTP